MKAKTPFLEEDSRYSPHRLPWSKEDFYECPSCAHTVPVSAIPKLTHKAGTTRKINDIRGLEVFEAAGLTPDDCLEDDEFTSLPSKHDRRQVKRNAENFTDDESTDLGEDTDTETVFGDELTETESEDKDWDDSESNKKQFLNILSDY